MHSTITVHVFKAPTYRTVSVELIENITDDRMSRSEENFFESNAEFILAGDNRIGENFRIGYTVGANFMYQKFRDLLVG